MILQEKQTFSNGYWNLKKKKFIGGNHALFSEIIKLQFGKNIPYIVLYLKAFWNKLLLLLYYLWKKCVVNNTANFFFFFFWIPKALTEICFSHSHNSAKILLYYEALYLRATELVSLSLIKRFQQIWLYNVLGEI